MKETKKYLLTIVFILCSALSLTSCFEFGENSSSASSSNSLVENSSSSINQIQVLGKFYIAVHVEVKSNSLSDEELEFYNKRVETEIGKSIGFNDNGNFATQGTLDSLYGLIKLNTWSQDGDKIIINEGENIYSVNAYISGEQVIIEMGNIETVMFIYTFNENFVIYNKTFEVVKAEVKSNNPAQQEGLDMYNWRVAGDVGKTIVFDDNGDFGDEGTLRMIATVTLNTWSQSGDKITINGGSDIPEPSKGYIDGDQVVIEVGNINGLLYVYTFEEVVAE